jgi:hypothetical protein
MFPGLWYAGKPIGLGIGPMFAVIWKFFAASVSAGIGTRLIIEVMPYFATAVGARGAFVRMVSVSSVFFGLYIGGVILLHKGLKPLIETVDLLRDLLPERTATGKSPAVVDTQGALAVPAWGGESTSEADAVVVSSNPESKR